MHICHDCKMPLQDPGEYHPHLFCTIWRTYKLHPADVLQEHGYSRTLHSITEHRADS